MAFGRPLELTPELTERICARIERGVALETACEVEGIHRSTGKRWLARGRDREPIYSDFCDRITQARAIAAARAQEMAMGCFEPSYDENGNRKEDPRAIQWWLERREPMLYGNDGVRALVAEYEVEDTAPEDREALLRKHRAIVAALESSLGKGK